MELSVGLLGHSHGWEQLLKQEGVPFFVAKEVPSPPHSSVLVIGGEIKKEYISEVQSYLDSGGSVLCSAEVFEQFSNIACNETFVRYLLPEPRSQFQGIGLVDLFTRCSIPSNANSLLTQEGKPVAFVGKHSNGYIVVLPFDAGELYTDARTATLSFYARRKRLPFERVSQVSKNGIRKLVARSLELLHHLRGLPYVHTWYYPSNAKSILSFRVDTDHATKKEIETLYNVIHSHNIPATWFVDVKSQEQHVMMFQEMEAQEIGVHCYEHKVFDDYAQNVENIRRALHVFENVGYEPKSFAAPFGTWNDAIAKAIEHCGFEYSSEFAYDYDNLPSYPLLDKKEMNVLQIPIHPVSIGSLRRQGCSEREMLEYFQTVLERKLSMNEPLFLYHHPKNKHESVLRSLFGFIKKHEIPSMRMLDFASWWKKRDAATCQIKMNEHTIHIKSNQSSENVFLHITQSDGTESWTPVQPSINLKKISWQQRTTPAELPSDIARIRKFNPWISINRFEDVLYSMFK